MVEQITKKRPVGQIKNGEWLVLTESVNKDGAGFKHNCGTKISGKTVDGRPWNVPFIEGPESQFGDQMIPYCSKCEE